MGDNYNLEFISRKPQCSLQWCWALHTQAVVSGCRRCWLFLGVPSLRKVVEFAEVPLGFLFFSPFLSARPLPLPPLWSNPSGFVVSVVCNHCTHPRWFMKTLWNAICQACVQPAACHSATRKTEAGFPFPLPRRIAGSNTCSDVKQDNSPSICKQSLLETATWKVVGFFAFAQIRYPNRCSFYFPSVCCRRPTGGDKCYLCDVMFFFYAATWRF